MTLLDRLRESRLYRPDQNEYILYPALPLPGFLQKNLVPAEMVEGNSFLRAELEAGRQDFIERDRHGQLHFNGRFRNADELRAETISAVSVTGGHLGAAKAYWDRNAMSGFYEAVLEKWRDHGVRFSPSGGLVQVTLSRRGRPQGSWLVVRIRDQGPGIAPEFHTRIFQKFSQADSSDS